MTQPPSISGSNLDVSTAEGANLNAAKGVQSADVIAKFPAFKPALGGP